MRDQPGPLRLHHLASALQAEDDPAPGIALGGSGVGVGCVGLLPAYRDEVAQPGPRERTRVGPGGLRWQRQLLLRHAVSRFLLSAVAVRGSLLPVSPAGHPALCPGGVRAHVLSALQCHLLHLLPDPSGGAEAGEEGRGTESPSTPAPLSR